MGSKIDKDAGQDGPDKRCKEEGTLKEVKKMPDGIVIRCNNDNSNRCKLAEDVNLKLGSKEWLIRQHLE